MRKIIYLFLVLCLAVLLVACNGASNVNQDGEIEVPVGDIPADKPGETTADASIKASPESGYEMTDLQGRSVTFDQKPENIVALTYGDLETIYALGGTAIGRPIIRGELADYLVDITEVGTTNDVNMEIVTSLSPDLVVAHPQLNATSIPLLEEMDINVITTGASSVEEIKDSIELLGQVLQNPDKAREIIKDIDAKIAKIQEDSVEDVRTLIVFGVPGNWMVALPNSLSGNMLETVGGTNIARDYPNLDRFPQYAKLDSEKILAADPDLIFLVTPAESSQTAMVFSKEMQASPAWDSISAVKNGNISVLPNNLFGASPGAKIIDSLEYLHNELKQVKK